MLNYQNFAICLARVLQLLRASPNDIREQKGGLRALVALTKFGGATVRRTAAGALMLEGAEVPATLPWIAGLLEQMQAHGIEAVTVAQDASPADLLALLRGLAAMPGGTDGGDGVGARLRAARATTVSIDGGLPGGLDRESNAPSPLERALGRLEDGHQGPDALARLSTVSAELGRALEEGQFTDGVEGLARLVAIEGKVEDRGTRRGFDIVCRRLLTVPVLGRCLPLLLDEARAPAVALILARAGEPGAAALVQAVAAAASDADRQRYVEALRGRVRRLDGLVHLLDRSTGPITQTVAELIGELELQGAVPALGRALAHPEPGVRVAVARALARIGTNDTVPHLRRALRQSNPKVRALVVGAVRGGRQSAALAMPLMAAAREEKDVQLQREYYRALGRIATPDAVEALVKAVQPGGRFIGRRASGPRIAALEGLRLAGGPAALGTVEVLTRDGDRDVRRAAREALNAMQGAPA